MSNYRTEDREYGEQYWSTLDNGAGYCDSNLWADLGFIIHELTCIDPKTNEDLASQVKILDVGCAYGFLLKHLRSRGVETWGVDYSQYALEHAADGMGEHMQWFDLTNPELELPRHVPSGYNVITCFETLEHIPETSVDQALHHLAGALDPEGILIATICVEGHPDPYSDPTHVTIKPPEWWDQKLQEHNLVRVDLMEEELKRFHLFKSHLGVFACRRR